jgi:hypothetical protein
VLEASGTYLEGAERPPIPRSPAFHGSFRPSKQPRAETVEEAPAATDPESPAEPKKADAQ